MVLNTFAREGVHDFLLNTLLSLREAFVLRKKISNIIRDNDVIPTFPTAMVQAYVCVVVS